MTITFNCKLSPDNKLFNRCAMRKHRNKNGYELMNPPDEAIEIIGGNVYDRIVQKFKRRHKRVDVIVELEPPTITLVAMAIDTVVNRLIALGMVEGYLTKNLKTKQDMHMLYALKRLCWLSTPHHPSSQVGQRITRASRLLERGF